MTKPKFGHLFLHHDSLLYPLDHPPISVSFSPPLVIFIHIPALDKLSSQHTPFQVISLYLSAPVQPYCIYSFSKTPKISSIVRPILSSRMVGVCYSPSNFLRLRFLKGTAHNLYPVCVFSLLRVIRYPFHPEKKYQGDRYVQSCSCY